jgi:predicted Rossmann fold nucleotide-binding protein DprA/Smf involved in DNA uptake
MTILDPTILSEQTQAILLLTAHFKKPSADEPKPLTPIEWGRFAEWLHARGHRPRDLLITDPNALLAGWDDRKITTERVLALLDRGAAMALAMEKWLRAGLWVLTRSDTDYPPRLKQRLREQAPPVLFGCGNKALLRQGGLAVAGSRKVAEADLEYSRILGERAADAGVSVLSGGAKGVNETAMLGALQREGTAVGVMADSLLRASTSAKYRAHLAQNTLVLVSPFYPEAGFNVGNAMQRNKYIYCLADAGLAVHAGTSGGTWTGATEVLKKGWIPLWVRPNDDPNGVGVISARDEWRRSSSISLVVNGRSIA